MSNKSKLFYLIFASVFFIIFNGYITNYILNFGYEFTENPIFSLTLVQNEGASFNIFEGYRVFLILFSACAFLGIIFYAIKHIKKLSGFVLFYTSIMLSGIFNNMIERIMFGYVRDFIQLKFIDFPVFNLSDLLINIGVIGLVGIILKREYIKKTQNIK